MPPQTAERESQTMFTMFVLIVAAWFATVAVFGPLP